MPVAKFFVDHRPAGLPPIYEQFTDTSQLIGYGGSLSMKSLFVTTACIASAAAQPAITIYNQGIAVVRESVPLDFKKGENTLAFDRATALVIPDSVVLRDPEGKTAFTILEQSYRNDPVSQGLLLSQFEGQTIPFRISYPDGKEEEKSGKVIRSGYVPGGGDTSPIIEMDGKLRFTLPGEPLFPSLGDGSILRPTLSWKINAPAAAKSDGQLSYLTSGFNWQASYNLVAPEEGEEVTLTGWVTVTNNSGTLFENAKMKLIAGDVNVVPRISTRGRVKSLAAPMVEMAELEDKIEEKAFDDFHLYTLPRPITLRDKETKQVELLRSPKVHATKKYLYYPTSIYRYSGGIATNENSGQSFTKDVAIFWEFKNSEENGLGVPLPAGNMRFYRADNKDGNLEFVGENTIKHTPKNEELSLTTGNAFDLVGERKITHFQSNERQKWMKESVEITVKNRSKTAKTITVRENLWRWSNWKLENPNIEFTKKNANTIEFAVPLAPDEEKKVTYTAHYTW
ncbi:MAG: hypothetical protein QM680_08020 [Luteolibacter sp.]